MYVGFLDDCSLSKSKFKNKRLNVLLVWINHNAFAELFGNWNYTSLENIILSYYWITSVTNLPEAYYVNSNETKK